MRPFFLEDISMGKPIRGEGQFPYSIGGFLVNGALINGKTYNKELYINKQRSYKMYDLIDSDGVIYQYVELVYKDEFDEDLNYYEIDSLIVNKLKERTFYLKVQDPSRGIYGFATLYQYNKVKVHTGEYIFREQYIDAGLSGVYNDPDYVTLNLNKSFVISASFIPYDYKNQTGFWTKNNNNVSIIDNNKQVTVFADSLGESIVSFTPDANPTHSAHTIINIIESDIQINSFMSFLRNDDRYARIKVGDEFTVSVVVLPLSAEFTEPFDIEYDDDFIEYIGTDDNLDYKFRVKHFEGTNYSPTTSIRFKYENGGVVFQSLTNVMLLRPITTDYLLVKGQDYVRTGTTVQYWVEAPWVSVIDAPYTFKSSDNTIASVTSSGLLTAHRKGEIKLIVTYKGRDSYMWVKCGMFPDSLKILPMEVTSGLVGTTQQYTVTYEPSSVPVIGKWTTMYPDDTFITVDNSGLVSFNRIPLESELDRAFLMFVPDGGAATSAHSPYDDTKTLYVVEEDTPPTSIRFFDEIGLHNIPVGATRETSIYLNPAFTNHYGITIEIEDESVVEVVNGNPYDIYKNPLIFKAVVKGLKRGTTKIKFSSTYNPDIFVEVDYIVF